ncbi:MAG: dCTP deaminase [Candidatus Thorarchaeota archaeon]|jgi:deoxycytidine triphosphate deaminase
MILGHGRINDRIEQLFPDIKPYKVGASSADVRIGNTVIAETGAKIDISRYTEDNPWIMDPGEFLLVAMLEYTMVPNDLSCLFLLKSTPARMGFGHAFSGWIDPGWSGILTMELKNYNQTKPLPIWPGMPIGQLIYLNTDQSGVYKGRYQYSQDVEPAREEIDYDAGT